MVKFLPNTYIEANYINLDIIFRIHIQLFLHNNFQTKKCYLHISNTLLAKLQHPYMLCHKLNTTHTINARMLFSVEAHYIALIR